MKNVLPDLINSDQTGFLKGRSIGEIFRLIDSIITYAESQNISGILLFIDFKKAFDTLEWNFIEKTLCYYNFVTHMDILVGFKTGHSIVTIHIAIHRNPRGPGFWKLNTLFLSETEYINQIRATIEGVKDEYQNDKSVNASLLWEMIKLKDFFFFFNFIIFTGRTLTLLTILILYLHTYTLHCSYLQYLYKQAGQTLTLLTILAL